jgi:hypothetical protein
VIPVLRTKPGCTFERIAPAGFVLLAAIQAACVELGLDLLITAGTNDHALPDPHAYGEAYDLSVATLADAQLAALLSHLRAHLPTEAFTVLFEVPSADFNMLPSARQQLVNYTNPAATGPHIHLQKRRGTVYPPLPTSGAKG